MEKYHTIEIIIQWIKFYFRAETVFDIHSPHMFNFIRGIENKISGDRQVIKKIQTLVETLRADQTKVPIIEYGAGSRKKNGSEKSISSIIKTSSSDNKSGKLLFNISRSIQPKRILELGTNLGIGTAYLASGTKNGSMVSIEGNPHFAEIAEKNLNSLGITNAEILVGRFKDVLSKILTTSKPFDLVFVDGHHEGNATIEYLRTLLPYLTDDCVIILDDVYWSSDMQKAFHKILEEKRVASYLDLFYKTILFLDPKLKLTKGISYINFYRKPWRLGIWGGKA